MNSASVVQLLQVGHFLFQKQHKFEKCFGVKYDFFKEEINSLLQMILVHMGIVRGKDKFIWVVNTEHYLYVTSMFWNYCKNLISEEEMIDLIHVLKMDVVQIFEENGDSVIHSNLDSVNKLFDLKNLVHLNRNKLNKFLDELSDFIRKEIKMIHEALEELGKNKNS